MKKILIWGTGSIAKRILLNGIRGEVIGYIETNPSGNSYQGKTIYGIECLPEEYDYIIVANSYTERIYDICQRKAISINKVIFLRGMKKQVGCSDINVIKELLGEKNYMDYCGEYGLDEITFLQDDIDEYNKLNTRESFRIQNKYLWPILKEKYALAGSMNNYFWQDLWAAKYIIKSGVQSHFDIGSRLDGFIAHLLAAEIDVTMIDVREFPGEVEHLHTIVDDATNLHQIADGSIESISALCSLEHFGLGRYGDPIDPEACFKCFVNIQKKLKKGGRLYLSVPIGKERIEFNAHRVFYASTVAENFKTLCLEEFSCAADGQIEYNVELHKYDNDLHNGEYRYGLFRFRKD